MVAAGPGARGHGAASVQLVISWTKARASRGHSRIATTKDTRAARTAPAHARRPTDTDATKASQSHGGQTYNRRTAPIAFSKSTAGVFRACERVARARLIAARVEARGAGVARGGEIQDEAAADLRALARAP